MPLPIFSVRSEVTKYHGHGGWHFVWVDRRQSAVLKKLFGRATAWGAIPVTVALGASRWNTSVFYSTKDKKYLMGLKAAVRKKEGVSMGDTVQFMIQVREA